jgi:hypothetical protein
MAQKILIALAALIVVGAAAGGGWWVAAERGWIAGKENSPRPENFKRALDDYLARSANMMQRQCAHIGYHPGQRQMGHPDTAFDWTPAGFLARADAESARMGMVNLARRLPLLAKHGLLEARKGEGGTQEYAMTWKGYLASNGNGCFHLTSGEREAKVLAAEKARVENGVEIYEVVARPLPKAVEPWAADPGFKEAFEGQNFRAQLEPEPVTYELARGAAAFTVIGEKSKPAAQQRLAVTGDPAVLAKIAGPVTPERVKAALDAYLQRGMVRNQACVDLPAQGEADESTVYNYASQPGLPSAPVTITFYNLLERRDFALTNTLRGYETMRRLESLGMAKSELLGVADWQGRLAAGGVRYELTSAALGKLARGNPRCLPVGTLAPEAVLQVQQFTEMQPRPRFVVRARLKPDEDAKPLLEKFGHFARMVEPGAAMQGSLRYQEGQLQVEGLQVMQPRFFPDTSQVRLPIVEAPQAAPARGAAPARAPIGVPGRAPSGVQIAPGQAPRPALQFQPPALIQRGPHGR